MNIEIFDLWAIGLSSALIAGFILVVLVHREVGPSSGLDRGGRWLLTLALGVGVFTFSLKMIAVLLIGAAPDKTIEVLLDNPLVPAAQIDSERGDFINPAPQRPARYIWESLPVTAAEAGDNAALVALGSRLFNETRLSADGRVSCASCHDLYGKAGGDGRPLAHGIAGQAGQRNVPTVWNAAFQSVLFWDGRARSLAEQAVEPILNPIEMGMPSVAEAERRLADDPGYRDEFARAYGDRQAITLTRIAQALAAYERTLITVDTPYDRFVNGDLDALSPSQLRGMALFESVGCVLCHRGPNFSDASLLGGQSPFRVFPANATPYDEKYRLLLEGGRRGTWRVPSLRNVALTGPWLHNGSVDRLDEVVRIMAGAQLGRFAGLLNWLNDDHSLGKVDRSPLSEREVRDIVAFLESLSSDRLRLRQGGLELPRKVRMPAREKVVILEDFEPFRSLADESRQLLGEGVVYREFPAATSLLHKGQRTSGAYFVLSGRLRVFSLAPNGSEATVYSIDPGETCVFALNSLFNDLLYPAWVESVADTRLAVIPRHVFRQLFADEPVVRDFTMRTLSTLVFRLIRELEEVHAYKLGQRLANLILMRASSTGDLQMTQQQMAYHLGTTREGVARLMRELVAGGLVETRRGTIRIRNASGLAALIEAT